jgi:hypothetical protein
VQPSLRNQNFNFCFFTEGHNINASLLTVFNYLTPEMFLYRTLKTQILHLRTQKLMLFMEITVVYSGDFAKATITERPTYQVLGVICKVKY